jgi:hypothetical protein
MFLSVSLALMGLLILQKMAKKVPVPAKRAVSGIDKTADVTSHPPTISQKVGSAAVIQCHVMTLPFSTDDRFKFYRTLLWKLICLLEMQ